VLLFAFCALCVGVIKGKEWDLNKNPRELFTEYLEEFSQTFASKEDRAQRYSNFLTTLATIKKLNAEHDGEASFGLNQFALLSAAEFKATYGGGNKRPYNWLEYFGVGEDDSLPWATESQLAGLPATVDWRTRRPPVVTPVKNQMQCGDCWAFSTTGNVEGQWALSGKPLVSLSEQQLCDCSRQNNGCNGGLPVNAMKYIMQNGGIDTTSSYPYTGRQGSCRFNRATIGAKINNFKVIPHDQQQLAFYVANQGPISIAVDATTWQTYTGGIIRSNSCGKTLDHAVLIVGYGATAGGTPFWIIKNSWTTSWGEQGYIRVSRQPGDICGVDKFPVTAIVNKTSVDVEFNEDVVESNEEIDQ